MRISLVDITPIPSWFQITINSLGGLCSLRCRASRLLSLFLALLLSPKMPVVQKPCVLDGLGGCVRRVAGKQQVISGLHLPRCQNSHLVRETDTAKRNI